MPQLPQQADRLEPAKHLFEELALPLADRVAPGASTTAPPGRRDVRTACMEKGQDGVGNRATAIDVSTGQDRFRGLVSDTAREQCSDGVRGSIWGGRNKGLVPCQGDGAAVRPRDCVHDPPVTPEGVPAHGRRGVDTGRTGRARSNLDQRKHRRAERGAGTSG